MVVATTVYYNVSRPWSSPEFAVGDEIDIKYGGTRYAVTVEAAKGHCFLGFKKEVHHEFNY